MTDQNHTSRNHRSVSALEQEILELQEKAKQGREQEDEELEQHVQELEQPKEAEKEAPPLTKEEETFKKRYGDLRAHSQKQVAELKKEIEDLKHRIEAPKTGEAAPKTPEEVRAWMAKYPDVAGIVLSIVEDRAGSKTSELDTRLRQIEEKEENFNRDKALAQLKELHPDFDELVEANSPLHDWATEQPDWVQNVLYDGEDPKAVGRVLDMYKMDKGIKTRPRPSDTEKAAKAVVISPNGAKPAEDGRKRVFRESEIQAMSIDEYVALEKDILVAQREGRVVRDLRGAAY